MINYYEKDQILKGFKYIDLFCGIGGFHLALSSLGAECVFASDINRNACNIYEKNFNIKPFGDITKIRCKEIPSHDILCAGFPCQPFSISGNKKGFEDKNGKLFFEIIRIARYHTPKMIVLENVKNLVVHNGGTTFQTIKEKLDKVGYYSFERIIDATEYGIPQSRKRIYIIAFKKNLKIKNFVFPKTVKVDINLKSVLEDDVEQKYYIKHTNIVLTDKNNTNSSNGLMRIGAIGLGRQGERIYSVNGSAITLSSRGGGPGGKTGIYRVNDGYRILTPRECARIMGFPDDFILPISDFEAYTQFGNSVVVDVIQKIVYEAAKYLKEKDRDEKPS